MGEEQPALLAVLCERLPVPCEQGGEFRFVALPGGGADRAALEAELLCENRGRYLFWRFVEGCAEGEWCF